MTTHRWLTWRSNRKKILVGLELTTGLAGLAGGALLMLKPDGSLLQAKASALAGSPFADWFLPGLLLATLVGGGFTVTALWQWHDGAYASGLSVLAGLGIIGFETAELFWLGFQPLEAMFAFVGVVVVVLASRHEGYARSSSNNHPARGPTILGQSRRVRP